MQLQFAASMKQAIAAPRSFSRTAARWVPFLIATIAWCGVAQAAGTLSPSGSGFFITPDGYFVTTHHVVASQTHATLTLPGGDTRVARVVATDRQHDLALLKAEGRFAALAVADSGKVRRGWLVMTVGYPQIALQGPEPKVTRGIVNSLSGIRGDDGVFQVDLAIQPGNSGGPLVADDGTVVGVISHRLNSTLLLTNLGVITQNVNYAVKAEYLLDLTRRFPELRAHLTPPPRRPADFPALTAMVEAATAIVTVGERSAQREFRDADVLALPAIDRR